MCHDAAMWSSLRKSGHSRRTPKASFLTLSDIAASIDALDSQA